MRASWKRLLAGGLCLCMLMGGMPAGIAEEEEAEFEESFEPELPEPEPEPEEPEPEPERPEPTKAPDPTKPPEVPEPTQAPEAIQTSEPATSEPTNAPQDVETTPEVTETPEATPEPIQPSLSGGFVNHSVSYTVGERHRLKGRISVKNGVLMGVRVLVEGYADCAAEKNMCLTDLMETEIELEDYPCFRVDTDTKKYAPLNEPGSYTLILQADMGGGWQELGRLRYQVKEVEEIIESSVNYPHSKTHFGNEIWTWLTRRMGLSPVHASAVMANIRAESNYCPYNLENGWYPGDDNRYEDYGYHFKDGVGFGLFQWTYPQRKERLWAFAREEGNTGYVWDFDTQMEFFETDEEEWQTIAEDVLERTSLYEATYVFYRTFENPGSTDVRGRYEYAREIYRERTGEEFVEPGELFVWPEGEPMMEDYAGCPAYAWLTNTMMMGDARRDMVAVALSQQGYSAQRGMAQAAYWALDGENDPDWAESSPNWNAPFISWCAHLAGVDAAVKKSLVPTPGKAGFDLLDKTYTWQQMTEGAFVPQRGDLIFLGDYADKAYIGMAQRDAFGSGQPDEVSGAIECSRVGIVLSVTKNDDDTYTVAMLDGDNDGEVIRTGFRFTADGRRMKKVYHQYEESYTRAALYFARPDYPVCLPDGENEGEEP